MRLRRRLARLLIAWDQRLGSLTSNKTWFLDDLGCVYHWYEKPPGSQPLPLRLLMIDGLLQSFCWAEL